ncbi:putative hydrolase [Acanthamoeba polyphaga mimivirus]|uniref:Hydrolase n=1 Tax=Acanthamoeba polyphaga mimivirus Kroon TaxID=3069720 RepID=A0A0G2Y7P3_9VIRU|nr:putative hydrolase [Acanthamoeba polyphaga mimivirus]AKI80569.1 putative hydrolase [Acanthamoeba polyphaga mimivirus Kroon]
MDNDNYIWLDYLTTEQFNEPKNDIDVKHYYGIDIETDQYLQNAIDIWELTYKYGEKYFCNYGGKTFQINICDRFYIAHFPLQCLNDGGKYPVLIFLHGLTGYSWHFALNKTGLIELANQNSFIVLFGQGNGEITRPVRDKYGGVSFGDIYWQIENPELDIDYIKSIMNLQGTIEFCEKDDIDLSELRNMFSDKIYFCGYSNGAMFSFNMCFYDLNFSGICSMMGGYGGLAGYSNDKISKIIDRPTEISPDIPVIILTGSLDEYLPASKKAFEILLDKNFSNVKFLSVLDRKHTYSKDFEKYIWEFFSTNTKN